jgi:hypothetical protein
MFYDETYENIPINFQILVIDISNECRPRSNLNFVEYLEIFGCSKIKNLRYCCYNVRYIETFISKTS